MADVDMRAGATQRTSSMIPNADSRKLPTAARASHPPARKAGDRIILTHAHRQLQTFFDELKNGTGQYRTIASLDGQFAQAYRGRCILELLQNAHDALERAQPGDPRRISFVLKTSPEPVLLAGNTGEPFLRGNFEGLCQLGQSPKDPNQSVGNKGLGFRSVLEVSASPEIWSTAPTGCKTAFAFRFSPSVADLIAEAAQGIEDEGSNARSPFDAGHRLLDWSRQQLTQYIERMREAGPEGLIEAIGHLSPYTIPLLAEAACPEVESLLDDGHVTVVRLPLDVNDTETRNAAIRSLREQLEDLDTQSTIFLSHAERIIIEIDEDRRVFERGTARCAQFSDAPQSHKQRLRIEGRSLASDGQRGREFRIWTRTVGGDNSDQEDRIRAAVKNLPNRWPEVRRVTIGLAVGTAPDPDKGAFVIFLPTEMATGTGAYINAPFFGSLDRRRIDFKLPYNQLLLEHVLDLCIDAAIDLAAEEPEAWRGRAVIDLLASTASVSGKDWCLMDALSDSASERGIRLEDCRLILCDDGWGLPTDARQMPELADGIPVSADHWRAQARFTIVSADLDGRQSGVKELISKLGGSPDPTVGEWVQTLEQMASCVGSRNVDASWDDFLSSAIAVLPNRIRSEPSDGTPDPLADARFLPDQDERLISAADSTKLFFQPVRGVDDAAEFAGSVPASLGDRIAFLHPSVETHQGPQNRNTPVQKFLDGRFARGFRREEILREVVSEALPSLPVPHGSSDANVCSELLAWSLDLLDENRMDALLPFLRDLPVACHGGWYPMHQAIFGPGWPGRHGDDVWVLADQLDETASARLRNPTLLPPNDSRWGVAMENRNDLFGRAGVFDGLRLLLTPETHFWMQRLDHELPSAPPSGFPPQFWNDWRVAVRSEARPRHKGWFRYSLSGVYTLPAIHHFDKLDRRGREACSRLLLVSLPRWPEGWEEARVRKLEGDRWSTSITSPLKLLLSLECWLSDDATLEHPLSRRWLVPTSHRRGQASRFQHLNPLSLELSRQLEREHALHDSLTMLGLNIYPTEDERTGPELLEALAAAWRAREVPHALFDVFVGQVRHAWRHFDPKREVPDTFLVRSGNRAFEARRRDDLADVFLPDDTERTRTLRAHNKPVLEMNPGDARRNAGPLTADTDIRCSSKLEERHLVDGTSWTGAVDGLQPLEDSAFAWLPVTILSVAAHGGAQPTGPETEGWISAVDRLRRARFMECKHIAVQLLTGDEIVAQSEPAAKWLPEGKVLAVRPDSLLSYEHLSNAVQEVLGRQDLIKDLRLVLGILSGCEKPTMNRIEEALSRAEIDAEAFADVRNRWAGAVDLLVDRIRPVVQLLGASIDNFDLAATDIDGLTDWLTSNLTHWTSPDLLATARSSRDDHSMGMAAWRKLGEAAQLPAWNLALAALGDRYSTVSNTAANAQTAEHIETATWSLRRLARHAAIQADDPALFRLVEEARWTFKANESWSTQWWEVPFATVMRSLSATYAELQGFPQQLKLPETANDADELRTELEKVGIDLDSDPYDIARRNRDGLKRTLSSLQDLHKVWAELTDANSSAQEIRHPPANVDPEAYLHLWSGEELLRRAFQFIDDSKFVHACEGFASLDEIRDVLELNPSEVEARRNERREQARRKERRRRTFNVAGIEFEVGASDLGDLFTHLNGLLDPVGPRASRDEFTPLAAPSLTGQSRQSSGGGGSTTHQRPSPEHRNIVGIAGEVHAYRFLRREFGSDVVNPDAWVSETRLKVLPPVDGEQRLASDGHGFDFRFRHRRRLWHVEVKSTSGDDPLFDLGITEIEAATRLARAKGGNWRILRVRRALSDDPEFDWLPNPFEDGFKQHFRLQRGGMRVSYRRKKD